MENNQFKNKYPAYSNQADCETCVSYHREISKPSADLFNPKTKEVLSKMFSLSSQ